MLFSQSCRLFIRLSRQTSSFITSIQSCASANTVQVRQINLNEQAKRKILLKINTVLKQADSGNGNGDDSDVANISCLSNELILSERMTKFPFHYRCVLHQQLAICPDRCVSNDEWKDLYNVVGESVKPLFGSITMLICVQLKHIERGRSLFRFIQEHHPQLLTSSSTTYSTYLSLLALDFFTLKNKKHGQDYSLYEKEIYDIYQNYVKDKKQVNY